MERDTAVPQSPSLAPEHDWAAASRLIHPSLKPVGTSGIDGLNVRVPGGNSPGDPLIKRGPAGIPIAYVIPGPGFEVLVGAEHLLSWGVGPDEVDAAAMANLAQWSSEATWVDEINGERRVFWSDSGEGMDAACVLLPDVRAQICSDLAPARRILVGVPERDLLIAAGLADGDEEFVEMFAAYVADRSCGADEPIDSRVFELVDGDLVPMRPLSRV
ncbi:MAG TPA: hypothetical protein VIK06_09125 [Candidatus Limnocylindrales bacterium]|jgi:hypothetical protein